MTTDHDDMQDTPYLILDDRTDPNNADYVDFADAYPAPLERETGTEEFPFYALPKVAGEFVYALSESTQTPAGLAGSAVLAVLSAAAGGFVEVQVRPGYTEGVNLFLTAIADSGERKSSVMRAATAPLREVERDLHKELSPIISQQMTERDIAERYAEKAKRDAGNASDQTRRDELTSDAITAAGQAESQKVLAEPRIIGDDMTVEALISSLADQGGRFAILSAEGGFFAEMAGRYSSRTDISNVLMAHAGDPISVDRKGRPSEFVEHPALTVGVMIQPGILAESTTNSTFVASGLMARFLYCWPSSKVGYRAIDPAPISDAATSRYRDAVYSLAHGLRTANSTRTLTLSDAADKARIRYAEEVEHELRPGGALAHMRSWAGKVVGAAVRIAGLIHAANEPRDNSIPGDTMDAAILLARYFTTHASCVFDGLSTGSADRSIARQVLGVIRRHDLDDFTMRDLLSVAARSWLPNRDTAQPAIDLLVEFGWLLPVTPERIPGPGRPPAIRYRTHPAVWDPEPATRNPRNPLKGNSADIADLAEPTQDDERLCPIHRERVVKGDLCIACITENAAIKISNRETAA